MATRSSKKAVDGEPGGLQSGQLQRIRQDLVTETKQNKSSTSESLSLTNQR